ncbi:family 78 glycoside hydrolase catalytic domain [Terribacillus saccharophilus]|uniref:family 78 glycoside hydrolase catalytic domain n=1 Tax=Terribacillus saccharophilus TaxID=361277 RepID=UPI002DCBE533|nr:family 78 glycoside hydrolase catalytic domain [Terribacillus saccharophilus]MEC0292090.1 family 78 glycoside hydrolase catalytic domain [Terribacillus saccharophilus]
MQTRFYRRIVLVTSLLLVLTSFLPFVSSSVDAKKQKAEVINLLTDFSSTPLGLDNPSPTFSWQMKANHQGAKQKAYQLVVKDPEGKTVWNTKKQHSDESVAIQYDGKELKPSTRYKWAVSVWNEDGKKSIADSWFETGLLNTDISAWDGAEWIGTEANDMVLQAHYFNVYKVHYSLQLDKKTNTEKASFILGANDPRMMDENKNMYNLENDVNESYVEFELDVSDVKKNSGNAKLLIYRAGYDPEDDPNSPLTELNISRDLIDYTNKHNAHDISLWGNSGVFHIFIDGENRITPENGFNVNPVGSGGNYIAFPMLSEIGFSVDKKQQARFTNLNVTNYRKPSNTLFEENTEAKNYKGIFAKSKGVTVKSGAYNVTGGNKGVFAVADPSDHSTPLLRTEFKTDKKKIQDARLYATARGIYELYLNGERVGEDYFNPGLTQYNKTQMYQTYDVTDQLKSGKANAFGAMLGEGWWSGASTFTTENWNYFGDRNSLLAKLVITYEDGTTDTITTNPDWEYTTDGPLVYGSFFQGEVYDANKEMKNWSKANFKPKDWKQAVEVPLDDTTTAGNLDYSDMQITGQVGENAQIVETLTAKSMEEVRPGVYVYDMGQNMVGVPQIKLKKQKADEEITLRYAEMLYPDSEDSGENTGMLMLENLRAALVQDTYVTKKGNQTIQPRFTFHGYRYIEITGVEKAPALKDVKGLVISSIHDIDSSYETSNTTVNKLWENITWSMRGNFLSIPTDTPARNERMGWNGDISVFSETATYMDNVNQFLRRHNLANRDLQRADGRYSDVTPIGPGFGGILWGSAGLTVPWQAYQQYGDKTVLQEHYASMKQYVDYLDTKVNSTTGLINEGPLGDWLSPENSKTENVFLWAAYHVYDLELMAKTAEILGNDDDAAHYWERYEERKQFFNEKFIDPGTKKTLKSDGTVSDSQASYSVPLALNVLNETNAAAAADHLVAAVQRKNTDDLGKERPEYSLMTGFIGTAAISQALSDHGHDDIAYRLLQQTSYPSWLYSVENGATTIWERLNSYTEEDGFGGNNSMNSFNHYSFGAVGAWMYKESLGIKRAPDHPGFKHFLLEPTPDPDQVMTWAKGHVDSMYGRIESSWKVEDKAFSYDAVIPSNTTATITIPAKDTKSVRINEKPIHKAAGVTFKEHKNGEVSFEAESGSYTFESVLP